MKYIIPLVEVPVWLLGGQEIENPVEMTSLVQRTVLSSQQVV